MDSVIYFAFSLTCLLTTLALFAQPLPGPAISSLAQPSHSTTQKYLDRFSLQSSFFSSGFCYLPDLVWCSLSGSRLLSLFLIACLFFF